MSKKRVADNYLTHDNWDRDDNKDDDDDEGGKTGPFQAANEKVLARRTIKKAARRIKPGEKASAPANPFSAFGGFGSSTPAAPAASAATAAEKPSFSFAPKTDAATKSAFAGFSFKLNSGSTDSKPAEPAPAAVKVEEKVAEKKEDEYFVQLASLNVSVMKWIDKHIEENSCVNLVPVFKDYEKHLKTISTSVS